MDIFIDAGGKTLLKAPQQIWRNEDSIPVAIIAGKTMLIVEDEKGEFELVYLDFKSSKFPTKETAKVAAPAFAQAVLKHMIRLINLPDRNYAVSD